MELGPGPACARHVRLDAPRCPFCDARSRAVPKRPRIVAQVTRAMVFYAGAMTACAEPAAPPEVTTPEPAEVIAMAPVESAPAAPEPEAREPAAQPVAVEPEAEPRAVAAAERRHAESLKHPPRVIQHVIDPWRGGGCCPPYGAPPADTIV
ncbi:MAG: hypothetical protein R3B82_03230 [Sandaracinaceae bacterium]